MSSARPSLQSDTVVLLPIWPYQGKGRIVVVGSDDRLTGPLGLVAGVDTDPQPRLVLVTGYGDPVPHGIDQRRQ